MKPALDYRWKLTNDEADDVLVYYGLRNYPGNLRQVIKVTPEAVGYIQGFDGVRSLEDVGLAGDLKKEIDTLIADRIIVDIHNVRKPATKEQYQTCTTCINNDLILEKRICSSHDILAAAV